jgi:hypothetical protein
VRDIYIQLNRCLYCGRPGFMAWDADLRSCSREVCKGLAFAEVRRRARRMRLEEAPQRYVRALLASLETLEYALARDVEAEVLDAREAETIRRSEREETARTITQLRRLERPRYATRAPAAAREPRRSLPSRHVTAARRGRMATAA